LRLVTWNINSIRLRLDSLRRLDAALRPDVLCLQETKVPDALFPREALDGLGYRHQAILGMKGYNGVAIAARRPLEGVTSRSWCSRDDCRHLIATVDGIEVHCLYVPAGGDIPDPAVNPRFAHKLAFLDEVAAWFRAAGDPAKPMVLLGDLNVAPLETDVWSHKQMLRVVSHTPVEVARMAELQASLGWVDAVRKYVPPSERLYTWWSYRAIDWLASNRGRRLDHVWVTPALEARLSAAQVVAETRGWQPPSDHVPVVVDVD
jgi:exodeoxyribonuclease III